MPGASADISPRDLGQENVDSSPHQSHRSPLRSVDCTAAPEGQTKFGFGKRVREQSWKSRPVQRPQKAAFADCVRDQAVVHSPHLSGGRHEHGLGGLRASGRERVPETKPAPGLSLGAQIPVNPEPRHRPTSFQGAGDDLGGGRSLAEKGSEQDSKA
ncbi:PREDICTED: uncharacterized protein LOC105819022 [Propithecus coquereli]|uniref:uncharacterized protein LOC105819022 n=1 Tax=Propithecus coquereli TaxID=379532 RepID=UPI00063EF18F|nr:PREDICTED: uncharacterized protein LOC105819022 [Propithecus coquereli]